VNWRKGRKAGEGFETCLDFCPCGEAFFDAIKSEEALFEGILEPFHARQAASDEDCFRPRHKFFAYGK
jgi:hypothetical protein